MARFLVVFDVDSTLINEEAIEVLAEESGVRNEVAQITAAAMRGEMDFSESLKLRVAMLAGIPESKLEQVRNRLTLTFGAIELISAIHAQGGVAAAVSGGFNQLLEPIRSSLKLDFVKANDLEIVDGKLSGKVLEPIVDGSAKAEFLLSLQLELGLEREKTVAVGDGANDVKMIQQAGLGIAFCAKPALQEHAAVSIEKRDLAEIINLLP
ncbi:MAG: phosphoserine phosphatase SerB [Actinomycetota bacterium]